MHALFQWTGLLHCASLLAGRHACLDAEVSVHSVVVVKRVCSAEPQLSLCSDLVFYAAFFAGAAPGQAPACPPAARPMQL